MPQTYTVKAGETLSEISQRFLGSASRWKELGYTGDPTKLQIGTVLNIPGQTPQDTSEIEQSLKSIREQVPGITAGVQTLMGEKEIDTTPAPPIDTIAGDITAAGNGIIAGLRGDFDSMQKLEEQLTKEKEEAAKRAETAQKGILASIKKREDLPPLDTQKLTTDVLAQYGYTPESVIKVKGLMEQLTTYNQQIADLESQKNAGFIAIDQRLQGMPGSIVRGEKALLEKQYNNRISTKAAQAGVVSQQIQMERGLWQDARTTTNMIVNAATYDQQQKIADIQWGLDTYADLYAMATQEEQTAWTRSYTLAKDELDRQQTDLTNKLNLQTTAAQNGINLGWTMTDLQNRTLEELTQEYSSRVATAVAAEGITPVGEPMLLDVIRAEIRDDIRKWRTENPDISNDTLYEIIADGITTSNIVNKQDAYREARKILGLPAETPPTPTTPTTPLTPATTLTKPGFEPGLFTVPPFEGDVAESFWAQNFRE